MPLLRVNDIELYYECVGSGEAIFFIHPPVLPSECFRPQLEGLSARFQVVVLDIRGHGRSSSSPGQWGFKDVAEDIVKILDFLGIERAWFCGYSAGASIAFELVLQYPDRVKGLIQIGAVPEIRRRSLRGIVRAARFAAERGGIPLIALLGAWINTKETSRFLALWRASRKSRGRDAAIFYHAYLQSSYLQSLSAIDKPTLFVYGEKDTVFGDYKDVFLASLSQAELAFVPNARHEIPSVQGDALNSIIEAYIDRCGKGRGDPR